jgi:hypothetical protein
VGQAIAQFCGKCKERKPIREFGRNLMFCKQCRPTPPKGGAPKPPKSRKTKRSNAKLWVTSVVSGGAPGLGKR